MTAILDDEDLLTEGAAAPAPAGDAQSPAAGAGGPGEAGQMGSDARSKSPPVGLEGIATDPSLTVLLDDDDLDDVIAPLERAEQSRNPLFAQFFEEAEDDLGDEEPTKSRRREDLPLSGQSRDQEQLPEKQDATSPPEAEDEDPGITIPLSPEDLVGVPEGEDDGGGPLSAHRGKKKK